MIINSNSVKDTSLLHRARILYIMVLYLQFGSVV